MKLKLVRIVTTSRTENSDTIWYPPYFRRLGGEVTYLYHVDDNNKYYLIASPVNDNIYISYWEYDQEIRKIVSFLRKISSIKLQFPFL